MSGEIWTDLSDVGVEAMPTTWPNSIQDNLKVLRRGDGYDTVESAIEAESLVLPNEYDSVFNLTTSGGFNISYISTTGRQLGNTITLIVGGHGCYILVDQTTPGVGFSRIHVHVIPTGVPTSIQLYAGMVITLTLGVYNGNTCWLLTV